LLIEVGVLAGVGEPEGSIDEFGLWTGTGKSDEEYSVELIFDKFLFNELMDDGFLFVKEAVVFFVGVGVVSF
jgi:hypothetical protein